MRAYKKTNSLPCWSSVTCCGLITIWASLISHGLRLRLLFVNSLHGHCLLAKPWMIFNCRVVVPESLHRRGQPRIFGRVLYVSLYRLWIMHLYYSFSWVLIYCSQLLYWKVMTTCLKTPYIGCYCFFAMWLHCRLTMLNAKGPYISYLISIQVNTILHAFSLTRDFWVFVYIAMKIKRCRMPTVTWQAL